MGFGAWIPFRSRPNIDWRSANLRFIDLDGDGVADVLISGDQVFQWHRSLGKDGFDAPIIVPMAADEERGPRLVFADQNESIQLADMSGDG